MITDDTPSGQTNGPDNAGKWLDWGFLLAVFLACALALSPNTTDPDLWGHVQYGRDALTEGIPATTTYSFTAEGYRWINHENLSEIVFAVGADTVGPIGLLIGKCLLGLFVMALIVRRIRRQGVHLVTVCAIVLLVAVNLTYHWSVRPQIFTFTLFTLLMVLLTWCFEGWEGNWRLPYLKKLGRADENRPLTYCSRRMRWLWLAPAIFFVWANTHGGFLAGYCIFAAILGLRGIELLCAKGREALGMVRRFAMMIVAAGLATLINPYGPGLHRWLLESLGQPRPEISEWHPIGFDSVHFWPLVLIVAVTLAAMILSRRSRDFTHLVLLAITLWQSIEHQRHIPFFTILVGFWAAPHVESMISRFRRQPAGDSLGAGISPPMCKVFAAGLLVAYALLGARLYGRLKEMPVKRSQFPVAAMQYMADNDLSGKLVVTYNWAQYAIAALRAAAPSDRGVLVSFDGRFRTCYPQEIVDMNFDFVLGEGSSIWRFRSPNSPPVDEGRVLEFGKPDLVLINRLQKHSVRIMQGRQHEWVLLYQDELAQVWGRSSTYDDPGLATYIPPPRRRVTDDVQVGSVNWPAMPQRQLPGPRAVSRRSGGVENPQLNES